MEKDIKNLIESVDILTKTTNDLAVSVDIITKTTNDLAVSVDIISKTTLKIIETMATKEELKSFKSETQGNFEQIRTELRDFKSETQESFSRLEKNTKENEENLGAMVSSYHPHIIALEEKVFGSSTLAEA